MYYLLSLRFVPNTITRLFLMMYTVQTVTTMTDANTTNDVSKAVKVLDLESWTAGSSEWDPGVVLSRTAEMKSG